MQTLLKRRSGPVGPAAWRRLWTSAALIVFALLNCTAAQAAGSRTTTVELTCGSGLIVFEPTNCQVTVVDTGPETPSSPTGTVSLKPDSGGAFTPTPSCELTAVPETVNRSSCAVTYEATQPGERTVMASYPGDGAHAESTASAMLAVAARGTALAVSCGVGVTVSQPASCTATVTDNASGTASAPSGLVSFSSDTTGGAFAPQASCILAPAEAPAQASCSVQYTPGQLGSGTHTITATYAGDVDHTGASAPTDLTVSAPALTTPPPITTTPAPAPAPTPSAPAPERPKCRVKARERSVMKAAKRGAPKTKVFEILVIYACDQSAGVRVGGSIAIAASGHGSKRSKAQKLKLRSLSSQAVGGAKQPGLVLMLPARVGAALSRGAKSTASVEFTVSNVNGIGVATIRFSLAP